MNPLHVKLSIRENYFALPRCLEDGDKGDDASFLFQISLVEKSKYPFADSPFHLHIPQSSS